MLAMFETMMIDRHERVAEYRNVNDKSRPAPSESDGLLCFGAPAGL